MAGMPLASSTTVTSVLPSLESVPWAINDPSENVTLLKPMPGTAETGVASKVANRCMPITFNYHAEAMLGLENKEEALYSAQQALALGEEYETPEYIGIAWRTLGMIAEKMDGPVRLPQRGQEGLVDFLAQECFARSAAIFTEAEIEGERARTLREWARFEFHRNNRERGVQLWQEARSIFEKLGAQKWVEGMSEFPA